jgi:hypothetical protein
LFLFINDWFCIICIGYFNFIFCTNKGSTFQNIDIVCSFFNNTIDFFTSRKNFIYFDYNILLIHKNKIY